MSATHRGGVRHPDDFYRTPDWCVHRLLDEVGSHRAFVMGRLLEPWAGDGAIVEATRDWYGDAPYTPERFAMNELSAERAPEGARVGDYRTWDVRGDVVLSNPPYKDALACATWALERAPIVALLLRLNWLEGVKRAPWHHAHPASVYVLPNRPSFTGRGTDSIAYAWFVWGLHAEPTVRVLAVTPKEDR